MSPIYLRYRRGAQSAEVPGERLATDRQPGIDTAMRTVSEREHTHSTNIRPNSIRIILYEEAWDGLRDQ